jgi:hypothetical protein
MDTLNRLRKGINELVGITDDEDLLDFVLNLLASECRD